MRNKLQICATGDEHEIRGLYRRVNEFGEIRELHATVLTPQNHDIWQWCSPYANCLTVFPEDELLAFLDSYFVAELQMVRAKLKNVIALIVCEYEENEATKGYSISLELIRKLEKIDASLEIDISPQISRQSARRESQ